MIPTKAGKQSCAEKPLVQMGTAPCPWSPALSSRQVGGDARTRASLQPRQSAQHPPTQEALAETVGAEGKHTPYWTQTTVLTSYLWGAL